MLKITIEKKILHRILILAFLFLAGIVMVYSVGFPSFVDLPIVGGSEDVWGDQNNILWNATLNVLNRTFTENGTLRAGNNGSFYDLNVTNNLIVSGSITGEVVNAMNNENVTLLLSNGVSNITVAYLFVTKEFVLIGNMTSVNVSNLNINGSLYPTIDDFFDLSNGSLRWRNLNLSGVIEAASATIPTVRLTNLQDLDGTNFFDYTSAGASTTCGQPDQTGTVTCTSISITKSQVSDFSDGNCSVQNTCSEVIYNNNASKFVKGADFSIEQNISNVSNQKIQNFTGDYSGNKINGTNLTFSVANIKTINTTNLTTFNLSVTNANVTFGNGLNGYTIYWQKKQCNATCFCEYVNETIVGYDCINP